MIRTAFLAGLLCFGAAVAARAGGDPASVAAVEQFLRDDEKAMLAAVLVDKSAAAEFNADVKFAGGDAKVMKLVLDKWRGRIVAYAETDSKIATPNVEGTYANYGAMMSPQTKAYLVRRLKSMNDSDRNTLIDYLNAVNTALSENDGKLTWYTKKVVAGVFDKYREDLSTYLPEPLAKSGKAAAPAAASALADLRKAAEAPAVVEAPKPPRKDPVITPPVRSTTSAPGGSTVVVSTGTNDALEQARRAAEAAERAGGEFDGGVPGTPGDGGAVAGRDGSGAPRLPPSTAGGEKPNLTADVPSPGGDEDDEFMNNIGKLKTGSGRIQPRQYLPGGIGAVLGGILGFFIGGPIGALIGAGLGVILGDVVGGMLFK